MKICIKKRCERMRLNEFHFSACWMNVKDGMENGTIVPDEEKEGAEA